MKTTKTVITYLYTNGSWQPDNKVVTETETSNEHMESVTYYDQDMLQKIEAVKNDYMKRYGIVKYGKSKV